MLDFGHACHLCRRCGNAKAAPGRALRRAGDVPRRAVLVPPRRRCAGFVVVLSGRIEVLLTAASGREILLYAVEPGQSCVQTTLGLMGDEAYSGEAIAATDARVAADPARPVPAPDGQ